MDTKGEIPLDKLLTYEKLQLELAIANGVSAETIENHKDIVASMERRIATLIAEGQDPKQVNVKGYTFDFYSEQ